MERHEILEAMSELKLYGMRASFDEIAGKGPVPGNEYDGEFNVCGGQLPLKLEAAPPWQPDV